MKKNSGGFCCKIICLCFLLLFFGVVVSPISAQSSEKVERTIIVIENARTTTYQKDKNTDEDIILLEGDVRISVTRGTNATVISADTVTYNRQTEMLYADGSIEFKQVTANSAGGVDLTAKSLIFNTNTLEGFFDDGRVVQTQSDALNLPSGSILIVNSDLFGRSQANTITFKDGELTFCDLDDPHWRIKASRIWLLPGNEFAFLNAVLFVGNVPVFYLPVFYYPKDELVFNPVFGTRPREGFFLQNTFYIFGRKPLDNTSSSSSSSSSSSEALRSMFNFMRPTKLKEQKLEGIVLHNLDEDYKGNTTNYLKLMADWYAKLGFGVGVAGAYKPSNSFFSVEGNFMMGFSTTIFNIDGNYQNYDLNNQKHWDKSNLFGLQVPFRYQGNIKLSLNRPFTLNLSMPFYSDPFFNDEYLKQRSETMDWINFITRISETQEETNKTQVTSFAWNLNSSYSVPLPSVIKPYLGSLSLNLNSSFNFTSKTRQEKVVTGEGENENVSYRNWDDGSDWQKNSPERRFYYPSQIMPANVTANISGTIFSYPNTSTKQSSSAPTNPVPQFETQLNPPDELMTEKQKEKFEKAKQEKLLAAKSDAETEPEENEKNPASTTDTKDTEPDDKEKPLLPPESLPQLSWTPPELSTSGEPFTYRLSYSAQPSFSTQFVYSDKPIHAPTNIDLNRVNSSMYTVRVPLELSSSASVANSFFTMDNIFRFTPIWQAHPQISKNVDMGGYTAAQADSLRESDYRASTKDFVNSNNVTVRPLAVFPYFQESKITWRSSMKIIRTEFVGTAQDPRWDYLPVDWSKEAITENALDLTFASSQGRTKQFKQSITFTTKLPPQTEEYDGTLLLGFPFANFSLSTGISRSLNVAEGGDEWIKKPIRQSLSLNLFKKYPLTLTQSYVYNMQDTHDDSLSLSLSWEGLRASYTMSYTRGYDFGVGGKPGWTQRTKQEFLPYSLSVSYGKTTKQFHPFSDKVSLSFGISTSIVADLIRPTNTTFLFSPSITFRINNALNITFSTTSRNAVLFRYMQNWFGTKIKIPGEENIFKDFINSYRFDDENLRRSSGFKLQNLNLTISHDLHDWDLGFTFRLEPRQVETPRGTQYDLKPYMSLSVVWRPMQGVKTELRDNWGELQLNP